MYSKWDIVVLKEWSICLVTDRYRPSKWYLNENERHYTIEWIYGEFIRWVAISEDSIECKIIIDDIAYTPILTGKIVEVTVCWRQYKAQII